jgi:cytochrome c556
MRATWMPLMIALVCACGAVPAAAQMTKERESECQSMVLKYMSVLVGIIKESKPSGACALANWLKNRNEEVLRMYNAEPEDCRKTDLGKNLDKTLKVRISQEANMSKRHCRRK